MVSQPVTNVIIGALLTGFFLIVNNLWTSWNNNKLQLDREKEQRIWQEESDQKKWYREKIYDCYRRAIQVITKMIQEDFEIEFYDRNYENDNVVTPSKRIDRINLSWELFAELAIIEAGYPNKDLNEFKNKKTILKQFITDKEPLGAQLIIIEIMENDSRMKI